MFFTKAFQKNGYNWQFLDACEPWGLCAVCREPRTCDRKSLLSILPEYVFSLFSTKEKILRDIQRRYSPANCLTYNKRNNAEF
jgi:hypothetical protein